MPLLNFVIMYDKIIKLSFKEEYLMEINDILEKFNFKGELEECNVFGSGHINTTYLAKYIENGKEFYNDYRTVSALTHNVHTRILIRL